MTGTSGGSKRSHDHFILRYFLINCKRAKYDDFVHSFTRCSVVRHAHEANRLVRMIIASRGMLPGETAKRKSDIVMWRNPVAERTMTKQRPASGSQNQTGHNKTPHRSRPGQTR